MEEIISKYLKSDDLKMQILGYLSVIFWGFAGSSNFDKKTNEMRAFSRVKMTGLIIKDCDIDDIRLVNLNNETAKFVGNIIETIISNVSNKKYSSAVAIASLLPQLGFSFATKLIMFIDPINCGVLDKVIAQKFNF